MIFYGQNTQDIDNQQYEFLKKYDFLYLVRQN